MSQAQMGKLKDLISGIEIAMLTTMKKTGNETYLHSRPMVTAKEDEDAKTLYFFSNIHSLKVYELDKFNQVNISYSDPSSHRYVSISGRAHIDTENRQKMRELWSPMLKAYFPKGAEDPDLALLIVDIQHVEYWDVNARTMVEYTKAWLAEKMGQQPSPPQSEHARINA